jgi:hypothetical protein
MSDEPEVVVTDRPGAELPTVRPLPWYAMIGVRVLRVYLMGLVGFLTAGIVGSPDAVEFATLLRHAASLAVAPAAVSLLVNSTEILTKLDQTQPQLRA